MSLRNNLGHVIETRRASEWQKPIKAEGLPERFAGLTGPTLESYYQDIVAERMATEAQTAVANTFMTDLGEALLDGTEVSLHTS
jgi:hypothetical protein